MSVTVSPNFKAAHAVFRLVGEQLDPTQITAALGIEPSFAYVKGELFETKNGPLERPTGIWALSTETILAEVHIEDHLEYLLEQLDPVLATILDLSQVQGLEADFTGFSFSAAGQGWMTLNPLLQRRICALNATLYVGFFG